MQGATRFQLFSFALVIGLLLCDCSFTDNILHGKRDELVYSYILISPVESPNMLFQDDSLVIQFQFDKAAIQFQLQNISVSDMAVDWTRASVGIDRVMSPVCHAVNFYRDSSGNSISPMIPSMAYVRDYVAPRENVYFDGTKWVEKDLLRTGHGRMEVEMKHQVGRTIQLVLPCEFGGHPRTYRFEFRVDSVKQILAGSRIPPKRNPPPPKPAFQITDEITAAILTVGIIGVSTYLLLQKKEAPQDLK